jgi:hypothetical protein
MDRAALGQEKYGVPLMPKNGRDHLRDAYQEVLDLAAYLRVEITRRQIEADRPPLPDTLSVSAKTLDEMAAILSANSWFLREGRLSEEEWQVIGKKEGYTQTLDMNERVWRNIGEYYGYLPTSRGFAEPHPGETNGTISSLQGPPVWQEDAQGFTVPAPQQDVVYKYKPGWPFAITDATPSDHQAGPTVLQHCFAADQDREGIAVRSEIVELLTRAHIPFNGLWSDHAAEVDRVFHERWPAGQEQA